MPAGNGHKNTVRVCPLPGKERINNKVQKLYLYTVLTGDGREIGELSTSPVFS